MPYLIDSDILIDVSRGTAAARQYIDALPEGWAISQVSALELIVGARDNRELADVDMFLSAYVIVPLRASIGARAYELLKMYAKSQGLHVFDSLVAATAIEEGLTLVSRNRRHFGAIDGLALAVPGYSRYQVPLEMEHGILQPLFSTLACVLIDLEIGRRAGDYLRQYRKRHNVELGDEVIWAAAAVYNAALWTVNRRRYPMREVQFFDERVSAACEGSRPRSRRRP